MVSGTNVRRIAVHFCPAFAVISLASVLVAPYGARLAHRLQGPTLRRIFAAFLIAIGVKVAVSV